MQLRGAGRQLALLFADIDDFKRVNDTLGHDAGDEVLVHFSSRIRDAVERHGGDAGHTLAGALRRRRIRHPAGRAAPSTAATCASPPACSQITWSAN